MEIKKGGIKGMKGSKGLLVSFSPPKIEDKPRVSYQNIHFRMWVKFITRSNTF